MKQPSTKRNMEPVDLTKYLLDVTVKVGKLQVDIIVPLVFRGIG